MSGFIACGKVVFVLAALCIAGCALAVGIGTLRPFAVDPGLAAAGFASCPLPCVAGLTPGVTPFGEAQERLRSQVPGLSRPLNASSVAIQYIYFDPNSETRHAGYVSTRAGRVGTMRVAVEAPLAALAGSLGPPDCVLQTGDFRRGPVVLVYWEQPDATIWALLTPNRWLLRATMREIGLSTPLDPCSADGVQPWTGFALPRGAS